MRSIVLKSLVVIISLFCHKVALSQDVRYDIDSPLPTTRQLAYGNARLLYPFDALLFLENPSILSYTRKNNFFITKISLYTGARGGYLYEALNLSSYNLNPIEWSGFDWPSLYASFLKDPYGILLNADPQAGIFGPLCIGYIGNGIGIVLYNDFYSSLDLKQFPGLPYLEVKSFAEIGASFGFSTFFEIGKFYTLHTGISLSYSKRYKSPFFYGASLLEVMNYYHSISNRIYEYDSGDSIWGDIGIILDDGQYLKYALTLNNFFGRTFFWNRIALVNRNEVVKDLKYISYIPPSLSLGFMFHLEKIPYIPTFLFDNFMVEINVNNIFNFGEFWFKKFNLGSEISILKIFRVRGGINQGYLTFGLGIDINYLVIDLSFNQYEKGVLPGQQPIQVLSASVEIKI